jgi:serine/threonine protein kinase
MFDGLKGFFGGKKGTSGAGASSSRPSGPKPAAPREKAPPRPKIKRVNLERRYTIVAETGAGSMSRVYRAVDNENGRVVCLKVQDRAKTTAALARSHQANRPTEGEVGQKIVHPHVVKTLDWGLSPKGEYFLVMEFIDGMSLSFVREARALKLEERLELLAQAAEGLAGVHLAGFIHHDFGPKNVLVTTDNQVKLIDFGLSVPNTPEYRRPGNRTGTLNYMAPELIRREPKDERIDLFSWGVTAFEFLTGRQPYDIGADADAMVVMRIRVNSAPMKIERVRPDLPPEVCEIINRALARKPADRWPSAVRIANALRVYTGTDNRMEDPEQTFEW